NDHGFVAGDLERPGGADRETAQRQDDDAVLDDRGRRLLAAPIAELVRIRIVRRHAAVERRGRIRDRRIDAGSRRIEVARRVGELSHRGRTAGPAHAVVRRAIRVDAAALPLRALRARRAAAVDVRLGAVLDAVGTPDRLAGTADAIVALTIDIA